MNAINIADFRQLRESEVEEPATGSCQLVAGIFALLLQTLVGAVGLCVLIYKRLSETPKRLLPIFWSVND